MYKREAVDQLGKFVRLMTQRGVKSRPEYRTWAREEEAAISKLFGYQREKGMPGIYSLVTPSFHRELPLVLLNYSQTAHNLLYEFPEAWTPVLRLCRGIVFDRKGKLVALAFPKFFNYGEHLETQKLPNLPFEATVKHDGHLGIIFEYNGQFLVTTRGDFHSPTSLIANKMLKKYIHENGWHNLYPTDVTILVEIIHPETKVYLDYQSTQNFTVIGAFNRKTMEDYHYKVMVELGSRLELGVTHLWTGRSLKELIALMKDRTVVNQEGYVVRFDNNLRVKFKFVTYIGQMVADKLSYIYLMNRMIKGNLRKMLDTLPEEIYTTALRMLGEILLAFSMPGSMQDKWRSLYALQSDGETPDYFRSVCRNFVKSMSENK